MLNKKLNFYRNSSKAFEVILKACMGLIVHSQYCQDIIESGFLVNIFCQENPNIHDPTTILFDKIVICVEGIKLKVSCIFRKVASVLYVHTYIYGRGQ